MPDSRAKGKRGELELAAYLTARGFPAKRGQQFKGGGDSPDVVCPALGGIHLECKRTEVTRMGDWIEQAIRDAGDKLPVIAHRKNGEDWVAIIPLDRFLDFFLAQGSN